MQSVTETIVITLQTNNLLLCLLGYPCKCFSSWHSFAVFVLGVRETERQHVEESNLIQFYGESKKRSSSSSSKLPFGMELNLFLHFKRLSSARLAHKSFKTIISIKVTPSAKLTLCMDVCVWVYGCVYGCVRERDVKRNVDK